MGVSIAQKNYLATNLRYLLRAHQISTSELARRCHIAQPVLHRLISGKIHNPQISTLRPIVDYFHCSFDDLLMNDLSQSHGTLTNQTTILQVTHQLRSHTAIIDAVLISLQTVLPVLLDTVPSVLPAKTRQFLPVMLDNSLKAMIRLKQDINLLDNFNHQEKST